MSDRRTGRDRRTSTRHDRRGRPRADVPAGRRITIRLTVREREDLEDVARENETSLAGLIRQAVNEYVGDYRERPVFSVSQKIEHP